MTEAQMKQLQLMIDDARYEGVVSRICPSNIQGSPYDYLFFYLTDEKAEGPHIIVSDSREHDSFHAWCVGIHSHWEEANDYGPENFATLGDAAKAVRLLIAGYRLATAVPHA